MSNVSREKCPVSGLSILRKPEWKEVYFGGTYHANFSLLGDRIIVSRPTGFINLSGVKDSLAMIARIVSETVGPESPYILIEDMINLKGNSLEARRYYISYMKRQESLLGLYFCNISTFSKISFKLAKRLYVVPFQVEMVDTYSDAVDLALDNLKENMLWAGQVHDDDSAGAVTFQSPHEKAGKWGFETNGYGLELEIIQGNILFSVNRGFLREMHIPMIEELRQKAFDALPPGGRIDHFIAVVDEIEGATPKARIRYMKSIKDWYGDHPMKMMILCGANRFTRTASNLARPIMPFKVRTVRALNEAFDMISNEEGNRLKGQKAGRKVVERPTIDVYVEELLGYVAQISWDRESQETLDQPSPAHPLTAVFDAILLIKSELDQLLKDRDMANEALRDSRDGLERRVAERTKELSLLNEKLREEVFEHKKTLKALKERNRELKETQAQLIQSAKLASIGEMAAGVAHELNQPLMVIRTVFQMMSRYGSFDVEHGDDVSRQLELADKGTKRMMTIIDHLQLFARQHPQKLTPVDINDVIQESLLMLGAQLRNRGIEVELGFGADLPPVMGNANQLEQVILNLMTNARDGLEACTEPSDGVKSKKCISVKTLLSPTDPASIHILVKDTGTGISPQTAERLFDPFFTTKPVGKGTGLGLSISYGIIKDHDGDIQLLETGDHGTTFRIRLPIASTA